MNVRPAILTLSLCFFSLFGEEVVRMERPVPNRILRQGEAQLIQDGNAVGVRILLKTRHLEKVQEKILQAETAHWPESGDSALYMEKLKESCRDALRSGTGKINFTILWMLNPEGGGSVSLVTDMQTVHLNNLSPGYLKRNLALIMADNFDFTEQEALLWIETVQQENP